MKIDLDLTVETGDTAEMIAEANKIKDHVENIMNMQSQLQEDGSESQEPKVVEIALDAVYDALKGKHIQSILDAIRPQIQYAYKQGYNEGMNIVLGGRNDDCEEVARKEGFEAGYDEGFNNGLKHYTRITSVPTYTPTEPGDEIILGPLGNCLENSNLKKAVVLIVSDHIIYALGNEVVMHIDKDVATWHKTGRHFVAAENLVKELKDEDK